jgi:hypothetical protein
MSNISNNLTPIDDLCIFVVWKNNINKTLNDDYLGIFKTAIKQPVDKKPSQLNQILYLWKHGKPKHNHIRKELKIIC